MAARNEHTTAVRPDPLPDLLQRALGAMTNGICIVDARSSDSAIVYVNEAFERVTGYPAAAVLGRNCRMLQGRDTDPRAVAQLEQQLAREHEARATLLNYRPDGSPWWNEIHIWPVRDADGVLTHFVGVQSDVTDRVRADEQVAHLAFSDPLTGVANRARLMSHLATELRQAEQSGGSLAVIFCDLDEFKLVNDVSGHASGDIVLVEVARRLSSVVRAGDLLARYGGDEFVIVLAGLHDEAEAAVEGLRSQLQRVVSSTIELDGTAVRLAASVGASIYPRDGGCADELLRAADADMYRRKRRRPASRVIRVS